jgi:phosphoribosyl-AMP cyclohydrolase
VSAGCRIGNILLRAKRSGLGVHYMRVVSLHNQVELERVTYYSTGTKGSIWYRSAIAGQGARTHNINNVDDLCAGSSLMSTVHFSVIFTKVMTLKPVPYGQA